MVTNTTIVNEYKLKSKRTRKCIGYQTYNYKMYWLSSVQLQCSVTTKTNTSKTKKRKALEARISFILYFYKDAIMSELPSENICKTS